MSDQTPTDPPSPELQSPAAQGPEVQGPEVQGPEVQGPEVQQPPARTPWRDRVLGLRGVLAVSLASLIVGGLGGAGIAALVDDDGPDRWRDGWYERRHDRMHQGGQGRWGGGGPGSPMPGGPMIPGGPGGWGEGPNQGPNQGGPNQEPSTGSNSG